ncbi:hypothetical protein [Actinoplanes teichomyceticus]|uniref:Uncharacterized protein n=1 Tax=Actinoplanes teichomyceticus TaxID=1867 RepID=A0A561VM89_ACTTI|nr:hypothetical protein [Actinoplanes teichomyceticus]TWG12736.1 hypothetical protein FHX34_105604 [Actinoplanes teichomyceticus]GIF13469.1 hypothetical protein Ate01nite_35010 [Actinoplanes teichomyceticus]
MDDATPQRRPAAVTPDSGPAAGGAEAAGGPAPVTATNAALGLLALVVTAAGLHLAATQADTTATTVLAGAAAGTGTLAVAAAVLGTVRALTSRPGTASTTAAGALSVIGLILVTVTGLIAANAQPGTGVPGRPQTNVALSGGPGAWTLTIRVSTPGLTAGEVMDAKLVGFDTEGRELTLGRTLTPADRHGVATTTLTTAPLDDAGARLDVTVAGQDCIQQLPLTDATPIMPMTCQAA